MYFICVFFSSSKCVLAQFHHKMAQHCFVLVSSSFSDRLRGSFTDPVSLPVRNVREWRMYWIFIWWMASKIQCSWHFLVHFSSSAMFIIRNKLWNIHFYIYICPSWPFQGHGSKDEVSRALLLLWKGFSTLNVDFIAFS